MWWRITYGLFRAGIGIVLLKVVGRPLSEVLLSLMSHELIHHPHEGVRQAIEHMPFTVTYFLAIHFIFWGVLDILLSIFLLRHQLWAFPFSIGLIILFIFYEIFRFFHTHSLVLLALMALDIFVIWLIWGEYQKLSNNIIRHNSDYK